MDTDKWLVDVMYVDEACTVSDARKGSQLVLSGNVGQSCAFCKYICMHRKVCRLFYLRFFGEEDGRKAVLHPQAKRWN